MNNTEKTTIENKVRIDKHDEDIHDIKKSLKKLEGMMEELLRNQSQVLSLKKEIREEREKRKALEERIETLLFIIDNPKKTLIFIVGICMFFFVDTNSVIIELIKKITM